MSDDEREVDTEKDFNPTDLKKKGVFDLMDDDELDPDLLLPAEDDEEDGYALYEADDESSESYSY